MTLETPRLKREHRTMEFMVEIYCRDHHAPGAAGQTHARTHQAGDGRRLEAAGEEIA
jgi:hypothetical protein